MNKIQLLQKYKLESYNNYKDSLDIESINFYRSNPRNLNKKPIYANQNPNKIKKIEEYKTLSKTFHESIQRNYDTIRLILKEYMGDNFFNKFFSKKSTMNYFTGKLPNYLPIYTSEKDRIDDINKEMEILMDGINISEIKEHKEYFDKFIKDINKIIKYNNTYESYLHSKYRNDKDMTKIERNAFTLSDRYNRKLTRNKYDVVCSINLKISYILDNVKKISQFISNKLKQLELKQLELEQSELESQRNQILRNSTTSNQENIFERRNKISSLPKLTLNEKNKEKINLLVRKYLEINNKNNFRTKKINSTFSDLNNDLDSLKIYENIFNKNMLNQNSYKLNKNKLKAKIIKSKESIEEYKKSK